MRLDLFLKTSRLVKRRTVARELCDEGKVRVNGLTAKPGREVGPGASITVAFTARTISLEILAVPTSSRKADPAAWYRVISETRTTNDQDQWNKNLASS